MPQLSLYLDDKTIAKIESSAKHSNMSMSKFVSKVLDEYMSDNLPENFDQLFGSISDDTFQAHAPAAFSADTKREAL